MRPALALVAVLALIGAACSSDSDGAAPPTPTPGPFVCPITIPGDPYFASAPWPRNPPALYQSVWYGSDDLWTMIRPEGENWGHLPKNGGTLTQKTWWWSRKFALANGEGTPRIIVTGKRLDGTGSFRAGDPGTSGTADFGTAMLVGIDIPSAGCWEIRALYKGAELAYVVLVEE